MPNLVQQQEIVQMLSDQQLQTELQQPTGSVPGFLLASEAMRRQSLKQQMASAQAPQETTVVDDLASQMGSQSPPMMRMGGGVRRYDDGGYVYDEFGGQSITDAAHGDGTFSDLGTDFTSNIAPLHPGLNALIQGGKGYIDFMKNSVPWPWKTGTGVRDLSNPPADPSKPISPLESLEVDPDPFMKAYPPAPRGEDAALRAKEAESAKTEAAMDPDKLRNDRYAKYEQAIKDMYAKAEGDNNILGYGAGDFAALASEMVKPRRAGESNQMYRIAQGLQALNAGYDERQKANKELELRKDAGLLALMQAKDNEQAGAVAAGIKSRNEAYKTIMSNYISQLQSVNGELTQLQREYATAQKGGVDKSGMPVPPDPMQIKAIQERMNELRQSRDGMLAQLEKYKYTYGQLNGAVLGKVEDGDKITADNP